LLWLVGVGSNGEDPVTSVRGADGRSWNTVPDNIKPERGQGFEDFLPDQSLLEGEEIGDILQDDVSGSNLAHDSGHLSPQNGFRMVKSVAISCWRDTFAREPADNAVERGSIASTELPNVFQYRYARPALAERLSAPGIWLAEEGVLDSGLGKSGVEQSGSGEERPELEHVTPLP
jgi:hypothetical protein